ncbi:MAG: hypothetical protein CM15mP109_10190 [Candidatus Dadabacteria bacterium]|nr:MAG: hypothetical protein CM15mP109_10190 [Candidatus Dadabacteria bacterium]
MQEAGEEITEELISLFELEKIKSIPVLVIDNINSSPLRNTLALDKSIDKETAFFEIYKILRPGEPPTVERPLLFLKICFLMLIVMIFRM